MYRSDWMVAARFDANSRVSSANGMARQSIGVKAYRL